MSQDADKTSSMPFAVVIALTLLGAAASFHQLSSKLFDCGFKLAHPELFFWAAAAGFQSLLFLCAAWSSRWKLLYRATQWIGLAVCVYLVYQLSALHARSMFLAGMGMLAYAVWTHAHNRRRGTAGADWQGMLCEGVLFLLAVLVIQSLLALPLLYSRGILLGDNLFAVLLGVSFAAAFFLIRSGRRIEGVGLADAPPLLLLAMVLLRFKQPDSAYDSLFYKSTVPMMLADWRTALTGVTDHTLLGTNLQEIMNAQLRILDAGHEARVLGMLAFIGLWMIAPLTARVAARLLAAGGNSAETAFVVNVAALLIVSLSEPLTGAGTAYQEPLQILLLASGVVAGPLGWVFLAAAAAVKATALLFLPMLLLVNLAGTRGDQIQDWLRSPVRTCRDTLDVLTRRRAGSAVTRAHVFSDARRARWVACLCALLAGIVFGEQLMRNQLMAGRLLAPSDMFASLSDPENRMLAVNQAVAAFDEVKKRPAFDNIVGTLMQMATLDKLMPGEEHGFHVFPSSRLPIVATALGLIALLCLRSPMRRPWAMFALLWLMLFVVYVQLFSQGRHMAVASFAAVFIIALSLGYFGAGRWTTVRRAVTTLAFALLALGDQLAGSFINVGWDCNRRLSSKAEPAHAVGRASALDQKLAAIAAEYLAKAPRQREVIPTMLCDYSDSPRPYMGLHYAYASVTHELLARYLAADAARIDRLDRAVLAVCVNMWHLTAIKPEHLSGFRAEGRIGPTQIFVSRYLSEGKPAEQLVPSGFPVPSRLRPFILVRDFGSAWRDASLGDSSPQQTPTGSGVLEMDVQGASLPTLVAPNSLTWPEVRVEPGDRLLIEAALPHKQSDGLTLELRVASPGLAPLMRKFKLKGGRLPGAAWQTFEFTMPAGHVGSAILTVSATSEGGDPDADWVSFRKLRLERRAP